MKREPLLIIKEKVIKGVNRGRKLGFPTANIQYPKDSVKIEFGVYIITAILGKRNYQGVANVGTPLTFYEEKPRIDIHLFDFQEDVYGLNITVYFWKKLREIERFDSEQKLIWQIEDDIKKAKTFFKKFN